MEGRLHAGGKTRACPLLAISRYAEECARESALPPKADIGGGWGPSLYPNETHGNPIIVRSNFG